MTAVTTSANKRRGAFALRFRSKFSEDMKLFVMNLVFQLLALPITAAFAAWEMYLDKYGIYSDESEYVPFLIIAFITFCLSLAMGVIIPMVNFRYLYNKSLVDMNYSLPLNNRQRFSADFLSGLAVYITPLFIGALIAGAELLISAKIFGYLDEVIEYIPLILRLGTVVVMGMILLYVLCVFAISFAGSIFEAIFSIVAVNIMIPAFIFLTWMNIVNAAHFGLSSDSVTRNYLFFTTSPVGALGYFLFTEQIDHTGNPDYSAMLGRSMFMNFFIRALLFTAVVIIVTYILYKRRKAEDVSKPYVYNAFYYAIMGLAVYCIISLMKMSGLAGATAAALIISGIFWSVMEVIRRRGFRRFWTAVVSFAAVSAVVMGAIKVIYATQGLGRARFVPSASDITDIEINTWGMINQLNENNRVMHDPAIINDVIELNRELVDRHFEHDKYDYEVLSSDDLYIDNGSEFELKQYSVMDSMEITMTYYTKRGAAIIRRYTVPTELLTELFCDLYTSEEYAEQLTDEMFRNSLEGRSFTDELTPETADFCRFNITDKIGEQHIIEVSVEEGRELTEALRRDIIAMTSDEFRNSEYYMELGGYHLTSACHNTVSFFEAHDIQYKWSPADLMLEMDNNPGFIMEIATDPVYTFPLVYLEAMNYENSFDLSRDEYDEYYDRYAKKWVKLDSIFSLSSERGQGSFYYGEKYEPKIKDKKSVEKLLDIATPKITGEKIIAEVHFNGNTLYVRDEPGNREIVEKAKDSIIIRNESNDYEYRLVNGGIEKISKDDA